MSAALPWHPAHTAPWPLPGALQRLRGWLAPWAWLRVDVDRPLDGLARELQGLHGRLLDGTLQASCLLLPGPLSGLRLWHRQADGEHYVYVEDMAAGCLAGTTVFNRLVEVGRTVDPHVRSPHSRYRPAYQRRGIAAAVYAWALDSGICLVSGARQSPGAHALWQALGRRYGLGYVQLSGRRLRWLGTDVGPALAEGLDTRLMLWAGAPERLRWLDGMPRG
jgi:hypothetical protein